MRKILFVLILQCLFFDVSFACDVTPDYKPPPVSEGFRSSQYIFLGRIMKKTKNSDPKILKGDGYKIDVSVDKVWKGKPGKTLAVFGESSSCSPFGMVAGQNNLCIFFINSEKVVLSGMFHGVSSECVPPDSPRALVLADEFEKKNGPLLGGH